MLRSRKCRLACSVIALIVLISCSAMAWAKVGRMALEKLVADSELIVVAKVSKVKDSPANAKSKDERFSAARLATAEVIETWKGTAVQEVSYLASPTWTCDISAAEKGEQVVLFLTRREGEPSLMIGHSGRGRMPLRVVKDKTYATLSDDVRLPERTATVAGPKPEYSFIRSIELSTLKELVLKVGSMRPATALP